MFEHGGNTNDCGCPMGNCDCEPIRTNPFSIEHMRCGCDKRFATFWDDSPSFQYEIVECTNCGVTWAWDYSPMFGNVECPVVTAEGHGYYLGAIR